MMPVIVSNKGKGQVDSGSYRGIRILETIAGVVQILHNFAQESIRGSIAGSLARI